MGRRIRTVKPEFFTNEDVQSVPMEVRYTLIGLFYYADDHGRAPANPALMRSSIFPLDDNLSSETIESHLVQLSDAHLIRLYDVGPRSYVLIEDWEYWQRVDRPTDSRLPAPPDAPLASPREDSHTAENILVGEGREAGAGGEADGGGRARAREAHSRVTFEDQDTTSGTLEDRPSAFCSKHPNDTDTPCWGCKRAREKADAWDEEALTRAASPVSSPVFDSSDNPDEHFDYSDDELC